MHKMPRVFGRKFPYSLVSSLTFLSASGAGLPSTVAKRSGKIRAKRRILGLSSEASPWDLYWKLKAWCAGRRLKIWDSSDGWSRGISRYESRYQGIGWPRQDFEVAMKALRGVRELFLYTYSRQTVGPADQGCEVRWHLRGIVGQSTLVTNLMTSQKMESLWVSEEGRSTIT